MSFEWNYIPKLEKETGYEDVMPELQMTPQKFLSFTQEEKDTFIYKIINVLRSKNIFPILYYNNDGIQKEIQKVKDKNVFLRFGVSHKQNEGVDLLNYLFPNLHKVLVRGSAKSIYDTFYDDERLYKIFNYYLSHYPFNSMKSAFLMSARFLWMSATNFLPMRAKAICEYFCEPNGVIYDYAAGFGGRMLGCLSSKNNYKYIGVDPCTETYENLLKLGKHLNTDSFSIYKECSESFQLEKESVDFCFSCPPYYKLEHYSNEETQCTNKYKIYKDWLEGYVEPTILNCYNSLKQNRYYGVVIADSVVFGINRPLVNDWTSIAEKVGFKDKKIINININNRKGDEKLYVFRR